MTETAELLSISKALENLIDETASLIFDQYHERLLERENTYIIPAVWGVMKNSPLDDIQKNIHQTTHWLVEEAVSALNIHQMSDPQAFALRYLINRCLIYTMTYKIETTRSLIARKKMEAAELLKQMPPSGSA